MTLARDGQTTIIRTERGLTISGTRLTLYDVMDFLKAGYSPESIRDKFNLTNEQIDSALSYIETDRERIEAEYRQVLQTREEIRSYWEEYNRERFDRMATRPRKPDHETLRARLAERKARRAAKNDDFLG